jgi:hypothetical protein
MSWPCWPPQTTFDAIQPPDGRADALRDQLEQVQKAHR